MVSTLESPVRANSDQFESLVSQIQEISTLPHVIVRTMDIINDPNSGAQDLRDVIEADPALSARILRTVNSAGYAMRQEVTSLLHAIALLGMRQIRQLAVTASVSSLFSRDEQIGTYRRRSLWKHLVAVGLCGRLIAMRLRMANFEDVFLAGLLHDVGIIFEDQYAHDQFCAVMDATKSGLDLVQAEDDIFGFDHTVLGAEMANRWNFPESVRSAIAFHHDSEQCDSDELPIVRCVEVANMICTAKDYSSIGLKQVHACSSTLNALNLNREHLCVLAEDLDQELDKHRSLLEM